LKPNISSLVGSLYPRGDDRRDAGFTIFYMGINIGALVSPIAVAWFRARYGWSIAFASAAGAMLLSLLVFVGGRRHVADAARRVRDDSPDASEVAPAEARARVLALLVVFLISTVFWFAFYQNGFTLTFWARDNTITSIAPESFQSVEPLGVIAFSGALVVVWGWLGRRGREPSTPVKMLLGIALVAVAYGTMAAAGLMGGDAGRVSMSWLVSAYLLIALGEVCLSPMGLSLVSRVAPPRSRGLLMGGWFVSLSAGGYLSGVTGAYWTELPHSRFFLLVTAVLVVAFLALAAVLPFIRRVLHDTEG
jgi:POT family proton-dependent oligopeptide transporter